MMGAPVLRRARPIILAFEGPRLVAFHLLTRNATMLSEHARAVLGAAAEWTPAAALLNALSTVAPQPVIEQEIGVLLERGLLVAHGSPAGERDEEYERNWDWGLITAAYHFGSRDQSYMPPAAVAAHLTARMSVKPEVPLHSPNHGRPDVVRLAPPNGDEALFAVMRRRRSTRSFCSEPLELEALRDCLFAGLGITGFASAPPETHELPVKMTPSGGARNPYEAYVVVQNVRGLLPGFYHYSGAEHSLARVSHAPVPPPHSYLGGQTWLNDAGALILLVADLRRTMRKYGFPTAYRVVLVEAGHIGQNIMLAATARGLAVVPTCAIQDSLIEPYIEASSLMTTVVYALAIGTRGEVPSAADFGEIRPNP